MLIILPPSETKSDTDPDEPDELAVLLAERWPARLEASAPPGHAWTMTVSASD